MVRRESRLALAALLTLAVAPVTAEPANKYPLHKAVRDGDLGRLVELLQAGHMTNVVRNSKMATRGLGAQERTAWIARELRKVRESMGFMSTWATKLSPASR